MKKFTFSVALLLASISPFLNKAEAQKSGGISPQMYEEIKASYKDTATDKALKNAVIANGMRPLVANSENNTELSMRFTHRVPTRGISDQMSSGRCWLFTGMNVLRAPIIAKYNLGEFFFSHNYNFFFDQLEKSNLFLQAIIDTRKLAQDDPQVRWIFQHPLNDGGQFTGVSDLIMKYGIVPASSMPETKNSNNTAALNSILSRILRQGGIRLRAAAEKGATTNQLEAAKKAVLKDVYRVLVMNLGVPPTEFAYTLRDASGKEISTETYTPHSFYEKFVGKDLKTSYVMLMNDPTRPYDKLYTIDLDRHVYDGENWTYVNLPIDEIKEMAIASLKDDVMMYYSCDVGKGLDREAGTLDLNSQDYNSLLGINLNMDKRERIASFDSGSTHAMTLVAVNLGADGKPDKWMVENSWGATNGKEGHLIMTDEWFDAYTFRLVVEKKYVSDKVLKILNTKPVLLPAWDPLFQNDVD